MVKNLNPFEVLRETSVILYIPFEEMERFERCKNLISPQWESFNQWSLFRIDESIQLYILRSQR